MSVVINVLVVVIVTWILRAMKVADGVDGTADTDYTSEREDPSFRELPEPLESVAPGHRDEAEMRR